MDLCVCVCERERVTSQSRVCVCVCARVCERERHGHITTTACVQTHMSFITVSVTWLCSPLGLELMVKLRTLLTVFTFILKAEARDYGEGRYIWLVLVVFGQSQCTVPVGQSEQTALVGRRDFVENEAEAGHRGPTIMYSIGKIMCFLNIKACQHILLHQIHKIMIFKKHQSIKTIKAIML